MKRTRRILVFLAILTLAMAASGWAATYSFTDTTQVLEYRWTSPSGGGWKDYIGPANDFSVPKVDFTLSGSDLKVEAWVNFPQAGISPAVPGVLAFDTNGDNIFDAGVTLGGANAGKLFTGVTSWSHTVDNPTFKGGGWYYGGKAGSNADNVLIPYAFTGGTDAGIIGGTFSWVANGSIANYLITIDLPGANSSGQFNSFGFLVNPADCGNGVKGGQVPLPPSALLLGTGLVGIIALRGRRRDQKNAA